MRLFHLALAGAIALSACSSTGEKPETELSFLTTAIKSALATLKRRGHKSASPLKLLTRAQLANIKTRLMMAHVEKTGSWAALSLTARNRAYETYFSVDRKSVTLEYGILAETRGLAGDLMESDISGVVKALRGGPLSYSRSYAWLNGEDHLQKARFGCTMKIVGTEQIEIVQRSFKTRHLHEQCLGKSGQFANDYWLAGRETVKSRQWAGKDIGYVGTWLLVR